MRREFPFDPGVLDVVDWDQPEAGERRQRIVDAVEGLPRELRVVVEGVYWEGIPMEEIARREGTSRSDISRKHRAALEALEGVLGEP